MNAFLGLRFGFAPRTLGKCNGSQVVGLAAGQGRAGVRGVVTHGRFAHGLLDYMQSAIDQDLVGII